MISTIGQRRQARIIVPRRIAVREPKSERVVSGSAMAGVTGASRSSFWGHVSISPALPLSALLLSACAGAGFRTPLVTDRPDFTESAATVERVQAEAGYTFTRTDDVREHALGELLVRVAVAPRAELRFGLNSFVVSSVAGDRQSGFEDVSLGVKLALHDGENGFLPAVALILASSIPTGSSHFGTDALQPEAKLALARDITEMVGVSANLNYAYASDAAGRFHQAAASLSFGFALGGSTGAYAEYFGFYPPERDAGAVHYINGGLTCQFSERLQVDARAGRRIDGSDGEYFVGVGIARRW
jgi:hypothetical protein